MAKPNLVLPLQSRRQCPHLLTTRKDYQRILHTLPVGNLDTLQKGRVCIRWTSTSGGAKSSSHRSSPSPSTPTQRHPQHRPRPPKTGKSQLLKTHSLPLSLSPSSGLLVICVAIAGYLKYPQINSRRQSQDMIYGLCEGDLTMSRRRSCGSSTRLVAPTLE